jgi:hypothetical protein
MAGPGRTGRQLCALKISADEGKGLIVVGPRQGLGLGFWNWYRLLPLVRTPVTQSRLGLVVRLGFFEIVGLQIPVPPSLAQPQEGIIQLVNLNERLFPIHTVISTRAALHLLDKFSQFSVEPGLLVPVNCHAIK